MKFVYICLLWMISSICFSQSYVETFTGQNGKGVTANCGDELTATTEPNVQNCPNYDVSGTNWTLSGGTRLGGSDHANVVSEAFEFNDVDEPICINLIPLDISGVVGTFDITVQVANSGNLESSDFVSIMYSIDGGSPVTETQTGNVTGVSAVGLSGTSTLNVSVCADNGANTEIYTIDNISVLPQSGSVIILPIQLLSFEAEKILQGVKLSWKTASEINNDYMVIERSQDGQIFQEIGRVRGAGTTSQIQSYSFMDERPMKGVNFFRLRQVDFDGKEEVHRVVSLYWGDKVNIGFHPNPVRESGFLSFDGEADEGAGFSVFNSEGRLVKTEAIAEGISNLELDWSDLPNGVYTLKVITGTQVTSQRIIKQ